MLNITIENKPKKSSFFSPANAEIEQIFEIDYEQIGKAKLRERIYNQFPDQEDDTERHIFGIKIQEAIIMIIHDVPEDDLDIEERKTVCYIPASWFAGINCAFTPTKKISFTFSTEE